MRDMLAALSDQLDVPLVTVDSAPPAAAEIDGMSQRFLRQCRVYPLAVADNVLTVAMGGSAGFRDDRGGARV